MENKTKTTPRTDATVTGNSSPTQDEYENLADFARTLERELAIELERSTHYRDQWQRVTAELRAERARLDWLLLDIVSRFDDAYYNRATIDAAMKEGA